MIICQCTGTTDRDIARLRDQGLGTAADIAKLTGAGRNCAPCRREITLLLTQATSTASDCGSVPPVPGAARAA